MIVRMVTVNPTNPIHTDYFSTLLQITQTLNVYLKPRMGLCNLTSLEICTSIRVSILQEQKFFHYENINNDFSLGNNAVT